MLGGEGKKPSPAKAAALGPRVPNLADAWARVHLARLCAALLLAEWTSAGEFAGGVGAPLLRMLVLLATRCAASVQIQTLTLAFCLLAAWARRCCVLVLLAMRVRSPCSEPQLLCNACGRAPGIVVQWSAAEGERGALGCTVCCAGRSGRRRGEKQRVFLCECFSGRCLQLKTQVLNIRDRSDLVALEAVRALFGALPVPVQPLFAAPAAAPPADDPRDARCLPCPVAVLLFFLCLC